jgi:glutaredoxin
MIIVYGADWCEDTRRSLRHLRRLGVPHQYVNIDEDLEALHRAMALNGGIRRTPTIDVGLGGRPLVEPDNDSLTGALVEIQMLSQDDAFGLLEVQNVGDLERVLRGAAGASLWVAGSLAPRSVRWPLRLAGTAFVLSGAIGWCPVYRGIGTSSIDGPGDRPGEANRAAWLTSRPRARSGESARLVGRPVRLSAAQSAGKASR